VRTVATNGAGTTTGPDQTFDTPADPPPTPPVLGEDVNVIPVSGLVFVKPPAGSTRAVAKGPGYIPLTEARQLPVGTKVDARRGTLKILTAINKKRRGKTQSGVFGSGLFRIGQSRKLSDRGLTTLVLLDRAFNGAPSSKAICATTRAVAVTSKKRKKKTVQKVTSNAKGKFRTQGHYSAATGRGTKWDTIERCDGTLIVVRRGVVTVKDFRHPKRRITLRPGKSYLAKAP